MALWILIAFMTFIVAMAFLLPLWRGRNSLTLSTESAEIAIYKDQMRELERDMAGGLISATEAQAARGEIARRLLAADQAASQPQGETKGRRYLISQIFILLLVPIFSLCLYLLVGMPGLPAAPLAPRLENPGNDLSLLVAKAERHLMQNPQDGDGWDVVAPIYARQNRPADAQNAYSNAIRLKGESLDRLNGLGEALIGMNSGVVTEEAQAVFRKALTFDHNDPRASYYLALALEQSGQTQAAFVAFSALSAASDPAAPWQPLVRRHIEKNRMTANVQNAAPLGNPDQSDIQNAQAMTPEARADMIKGMVESLDAKLKADPNNLEGWKRLIRSYSVLKNEAKAMDALKQALLTFPPATENGQALLALGRETGLAVDDLAK